MQSKSRDADVVRTHERTKRKVREVGGTFQMEKTHVHLWLIHDDVWQKPTQYYKAIIFQLKINKYTEKD